MQYSGLLMFCGQTQSAKGEIWASVSLLFFHEKKNQLYDIQEFQSFTSFNIIFQVNAKVNSF